MPSLYANHAAQGNASKPLNHQVDLPPEIVETKFGGASVPAGRQENRLNNQTTK
jgi:hypothetical protein